MTSNLGSQRVHDHDGDYASMKELVMQSVTEYFRPEFINRVDDIVVFHALGSAHVRAIANIQIEILRARLAEQEIHLEIEDTALDKISAAGFDPVYGARPLKRAIQNLLENPLAQQLLGGHFGPGDAVLVSLLDDQIVFNDTRAKH